MCDGKTRQSQPAESSPDRGLVKCGPMRIRASVINRPEAMDPFQPDVGIGLAGFSLVQRIGILLRGVIGQPEQILIAVLPD